MKKMNGPQNDGPNDQNTDNQNEQNGEKPLASENFVPVQKGKKTLVKKNAFIEGQVSDQESEPPADTEETSSTVDVPDTKANNPAMKSIPAEKSAGNAGKKAKKIKKPWSKRKKIIVSSILGVIFLAIVGIGIYITTLLNNPLAAFEDVAHQASNMPSPTQTSSDEPSETPSVSKDPYDDLIAKADNSILKDMINILLIGVDHSVERETKHWDFKDFHSDVMIVLSINKVTKAFNMISLPRDTWAQIPGVKGIYKLNASIDCGGGWPTDGGFNKVCEAAEWMLGGNIPVDYYYAVDMNAVKGLVDSIGGVDYNVDLDFEIMGRSYKEGQQHMDGQAVLDYLRVRKGLDRDEAGDLNRIDRQKKNACRHI